MNNDIRMVESPNTNEAKPFESEGNNQEIKRQLSYSSTSISDSSSSISPLQHTVDNNASTSSNTRTLYRVREIHRLKPGEKPPLGATLVKIPEGIANGNQPIHRLERIRDLEPNEQLPEGIKVIHRLPSLNQLPPNTKILHKLSPGERIPEGANIIRILNRNDNSQNQNQNQNLHIDNNLIYKINNDNQIKSLEEIDSEKIHPDHSTNQASSSNIDTLSTLSEDKSAISKIQNIKMESNENSFVDSRNYNNSNHLSVDLNSSLNESNSNILDSNLNAHSEKKSSSQLSQASQISKSNLQPQIQSQLQSHSHLHTQSGIELQEEPQTHSYSQSHPNSQSTTQNVFRTFAPPQLQLTEGQPQTTTIYNRIFPINELTPNHNHRQNRNGRAIHQFQRIRQLPQGAVIPSNVNPENIHHIEVGHNREPPSQEIIGILNNVLNTINRADSDETEIQLSITTDQNQNMGEGANGQNQDIVDDDEVNQINQLELDQEFDIEHDHEMAIDEEINDEVDTFDLINNNLDSPSSSNSNQENEEDIVNRNENENNDQENNGENESDDLVEYPSEIKRARPCKCCHLKSNKFRGTCWYSRYQMFLITLAHKVSMKKVHSYWHFITPDFTVDGLKMYRFNQRNQETWWGFKE